MTVAAVEVALIAAVLSIISSLINRHFSSKGRLKEIKDEVKRVQKEWSEAKKSGDEQRIAEAEKNFKKSLGLQKEMMMLSFKPMLITMIPFAAVVFLYMWPQYGSLGNIVELPIVNWELSWLWWYMVIALFVALVMNIIFKVYDNKKEK
jgi:uncharacterized membrane protein (DUF106 family)